MNCIERKQTAGRQEGNLSELVGAKKCRKMQATCSTRTVNNDLLIPIFCNSMAHRPPAPTSNAGAARPRAQPLSSVESKAQPPSVAARPRTALGASRLALLVSDGSTDESSDDDGDGVIRRHSGTFVAPPPVRGSTPAVSRPVVRQLQLPAREQQVQRMVISDDGSGDAGGNVSGAVWTAVCPAAFSPRLQAMMTRRH
jgi:hypothetical protein